MHAAIASTSGSPVLFQARLTPHRSLGSRGFFWLMMFVSTVCLTVGIVFFLMGLWPVLGFMGLDILLMYVAFKASFRQARAYEDVAVSRDEFLVRKVTQKGRTSEHRFAPFGTQLKVDRHPEFGVRSMALASRNRLVGVGDFLNPDDKETFAEAFGLAIAKAKR